MKKENKFLRFLRLYLLPVWEKLCKWYLEKAGYEIKDPKDKK